MAQKKNEDTSLIDGIKRIAYNKINQDIEQKLVFWWCDKYKLPPTDERLLNYTVEELILEYFMDLFREDQEEMRSMMTDEEIEEISYEDEEIEEINEEFLKRGKVVDLTPFKAKDNGNS